MEAVINYHGRAVRTSNLINPRKNISGILASFEYNDEGKIKKYALIYRRSFRNDQGEGYNNSVVTDYFEVEKFSEHIARPSSVTLKILKDNHIFKKFEKALTGDDINVKRINYQAPYEFYKSDNYHVEHVVHKNYNGTNGLDVSLLGPSNIVVSNQPEPGEGYFLNHINAINDIDDPDEKEIFARIITKSGLWINMIVRTVFPILVDAVDDSPDNIAFVNRLIYGNTTTNEKGLLDIWSDDVLFTEISIPVVKDYLLALSSFYRFCFANQEYIKGNGDKVKTLLMDIMPIQSLATLPFSIKKDFLNDYIDNERSLKERDERAISRIVSSINTGNASSFLDYLMETNGLKTNFEILYGFVTDSRLANWGWVGQLLTLPLGKGYPNRQVFIFSLYKLWLESKYNFYPTDNNNPPVLDNGIRTDCFWLIPGEDGGLKYFETTDSNPILEFYTYESLLYSDEITYEPGLTIVDKTFPIYKNTKIVKLIEGYDALETQTSREKYGDYHLFQPIALVGFDSNRNIVIPEFSLIPSFLFYYAVEFDKIKDYDAGLSLFIEVGLEVGLFFSTGGMATLRHLRHIKHITKLNKARKGLLLPTDEVLVWRGLESASTTTSVTSSMLASFFNYIDDTSNQDEELAKKLKLFFLVLTFTSLGAGAFSSYKTISAADDVLKRVDELTLQGTPANLTQETIDVIKAVRNTGDVLFSLFKNRISGYSAAELGETNRLFTTFNTFSADAQKEFWRHFGKLEDLNFWKKMNKNNAQLVSTWDEIVHLKEIRKNINFLISYRLVKDSAGLQKHVHIGEVVLTPSAGFTKAVVSGYHNPIKLVPPPPGPGQISWRTTVRNSNPSDPTKGYTIGKIEKNINEIDPATGLPWQNANGSSIKVKKDKNVFWPESYNTQRINEEMAYARTNMDINNTVVKTHGSNTATIYTGFATDGHKIDILYVNGNHLNGTLRTIYPKYF